MNLHQTPAADRHSENATAEQGCQQRWSRKTFVESPSDFTSRAYGKPVDGETQTHWNHPGSRNVLLNRGVEQSQPGERK